jgi:hypothetical protein
VPFARDQGAITRVRADGDLITSRAMRSFSPHHMRGKEVKSNEACTVAHQRRQGRRISTLTAERSANHLNHYAPSHNGTLWVEDGAPKVRSAI